MTHFDAKGQAIMVDVGAKASTERTASAEANVSMSHNTLQMIMDGRHKKGDVLAIARIAGIMAAKNTSSLIPLCHPLALTSVTVELDCYPETNSVKITSTCKLTWKTGVEMESLTAVTISALTIYDMCKAIDRSIAIQDIRLVKKSGGRTGEFEMDPGSLGEKISRA